MRIDRPPYSTTHTNYTLNNIPLSHVSTIKYLGVHIDSRLSFDAHIQETCKKATRILHMLMRNLKKARTRTRTLAYNTICRPILEYASHCWSPHLAKHVSSLEAINRRAFRWAFYKKRRDQISDLMFQMDWQILADRRKHTDLKMYFRIIEGSVAINSDKVSLSQSHSYHTRTGAIHGSINTEVKRNTFQQRIYRYLNA